MLAEKTRAGSKGYLVDIAERRDSNIFKSETATTAYSASKSMHQLENHVQLVQTT
jgi:hypothetical protein